MLRMRNAARWSLWLAIAALGAGGCATTDERSTQTSTNGGPTPAANTATPAPAASTAAPAATTTGGPCLVVVRDGMTRGPAGPRLEVAVWKDGAMLLVSRTPGAGGGTAQALVAQTDAAAVEKVLQVVRTAGFYAAPQKEYLVPDSPFQVILAHDGEGKGRCAWHGQLNPAFGGDLNTDAAYRKFIAMWRQVRGTIDTLPLSSVKRLEDLPGGTTGFRGYDVSDPASTPWLK